jgi:hypothetical protein
MMTNVPQFIDVEDKVAGPFTWKQLGWMLGMGAALFLLYATVDKGLFYILAIPIALLFIALAFYRPNGMAFPQFIFYSVAFLFRPKVMVWERPMHHSSTVTTSQPQETVEKTETRKLSTAEIAALASRVDRKR